MINKIAVKNSNIPLIAGARILWSINSSFLSRLSSRGHLCFLTGAGLRSVPELITSCLTMFSKFLLNDGAGGSNEDGVNSAGGGTTQYRRPTDGPAR